MTPITELDATLKDFISQFGCPNDTNSRMYTSLLKDLLVQNPHEGKILEISLEEKIPERLFSQKENVQSLFPQLVQELSQKGGIDLPSAEWAVSVWMNALDIRSAPSLQQQPGNPPQPYGNVQEPQYPSPPPYAPPVQPENSPQANPSPPMNQGSGGQPIQAQQGYTGQAQQSYNPPYEGTQYYQQQKYAPPDQQGGYPYGNPQQPAGTQQQGYTAQGQPPYNPPHYQQQQYGNPTQQGGYPYRNPQQPAGSPQQAYTAQGQPPYNPPHYQQQQYGNPTQQGGYPYGNPQQPAGTQQQGYTAQGQPSHNPPYYQQQYGNPYQNTGPGPLDYNRILTLLRSTNDYKPYVLVGCLLSFVALFLPFYSTSALGFSTYSDMSTNPLFPVYFILILMICGVYFFGLSEKLPYPIFIIGLSMLSLTVLFALFILNYFSFLTQSLDDPSDPGQGLLLLAAMFSNTTISYGFFIEFIGAAIITVSGYYDYYLKTGLPIKQALTGFRRRHLR